MTLEQAKLTQFSFELALPNASQHSAGKQLALDLL
jgi:hypothetical protein